MTAWSPGWDAFDADLLAFWTERHLLSLTTLRPDGTPHVVPVGVALDLERECAWVITSRHSQKVRHLPGGTAGVPPPPDGGAPVAACQVDGARWSTLEGRAVVTHDRDDIERAVGRYAARYRVPRPNPDRVALRITVDRFLSSSRLVPRGSD